MTRKKKRMKPDAYLKLYIGDWLKDTMHLDATSTGAYFLLCMSHWGKPHISADDADLRTTAKVRECDWMRVKGQIEGFFETKQIVVQVVTDNVTKNVTKNVWAHGRIARDWKTAIEEYEAQCERTRKATLARFPNVTGNVTSDVTSNVTGTQSESESVGSLYYAEHVLPPGFPKTKGEAIANATQANASIQFVEAIWNKAMARGGRDAKGLPIRSWVHYVSTEWGYEQERIRREKNATRNSTKPNPRNAGILADPDQVGRDILAEIERRKQREKADKETLSH